MAEQLEMQLAAQSRGPATVYLFPLDREAGRIERMARALDRKSALDGERYWRTEISRLSARMAVLGVDPQEQQAQIARFALAVQAALDGEQGRGA